MVHERSYERNAQLSSAHTGNPESDETRMVTANRSIASRWGTRKLLESDWLADAKSDARRSTLAGVLTPEQLDVLLSALKGTEGVS